MSAALVRESLELVESSGKKHDKTKQEKDSRGLHGKQKHSSLMQKKLKKVTTSGGVQLSIDELRMRLRVHEDRTEGNVRMLQRLGETTDLDESAANKIFQRAVKGKVEPIKSDPKEESTAFTEEDFKKFEEEYFVS